MKVFEMLNHIKKELAQVGILDNAESEWLLALALNVKRNSLRTLTELSVSQVENIKKALEKRKKHIPLSYAMFTSTFSILIGKNVRFFWQLLHHITTHNSNM